MSYKKDYSYVKIEQIDHTHKYLSLVDREYVYTNQAFINRVVYLGGVMIHSGHHPRHSYRYGYGYGYWRSPWCDYRLGWCDPYYYPYRPHAGVYVPMGDVGLSIRF